MDEIVRWLGLFGFLIVGLVWLLKPTAEQQESLPTGLIGCCFLAIAALNAYALYRFYTQPA